MTWIGLLFGNFLFKEPIVMLNYAITILIMYATWFDMQCRPACVSGHFDDRKRKQACLHFLA